MQLTEKDKLDLLNELMDLRNEVREEGYELYNHWLPKIEREEFKESALNLAAYLALRRRDIRDLQGKLIPFGLSSLGRIEARTLYNLDAVIINLARILDVEIKDIEEPKLQDFDIGNQTLQNNNELIFGQLPDDRYAYVMATMPNEVAEEVDYADKLLKAGMDIARINCAKDDKKTWSKMIENIHAADKNAGIKTPIAMDIAGPKVRINALMTNLKKARVSIGDKIFLAHVEKLDNFYGHSLVIKTTLPTVVKKLEIGDPVLIDDGMIETEVSKKYDEGVQLHVTKLLSGSSKRVKANSGIHFPTVSAAMPILTEKDKKDLEFVVEHADMINISFVRDAEDIKTVQKAVEKLVGKERAKNIPLIAKIETVAGVNNLTEIIVQGASKNPFGVMIARGDLAVEAGYLRLAELQEEILWICEAAQIPVIWATQVLNSLVKSGIPTRAEITDAAMGSRADAILLNKGDYLIDGIRSLIDILQRMKDHQYKKTAKLRALNIAKIQNFDD